MARPKKMEIDIPTDAPIEEEPPVEPVAEEPVAEPTGTVAEILVNPEQYSDTPVGPIPVYEIPGLSDDEKLNIVRSRIGNIISKSQIPFIPALIRFREGGSNTPPIFAVIDIDHRYVEESWNFYKMNVINPDTKEFFEIVRSLTKNPERIITRIVNIDLT